MREPAKRSCEYCPRTDCRIRRGRCPRCYNNWRRRQQAYGRWDELNTYTSAERVREHIEKLAASGFNYERQARAAEVHPLQFWRIRKGLVTKTAKTTADRILALKPLEAGRWEGMHPRSLIPGHGARRRLQALVADGHTMKSLADRLDMPIQTLQRAIKGRTSTSHGGGWGLVTLEFYERVRALYEELEHTPGDSLRARLLGERQVWYRPIMWDEDQIDLPDGQPALDAPRWLLARVYEDAEEVVRLRLLGFTHAQIAKRMNIPKGRVVWVQRRAMVGHDDPRTSAPVDRRKLKKLEDFGETA